MSSLASLSQMDSSQDKLYSAHHSYCLLHIFLLKLVFILTNHIHLWTGMEVILRFACNEKLILLSEETFKPSAI